MTFEEIEAEITKRMPLEDFLRIQERLTFLRKEEEEKLKALAELQQIYLAANSDQQRDTVKLAVAEIRELSRKTREELRSLNTLLHQNFDLSRAKELYKMYLDQKHHNPK